jgi:predicted dehydrogenase
MSSAIVSSRASRRSFLGAAAITAASYSRVLGANDRIGVGLIGFGLIGKQHAGDFKKMKDVELTALCDVYQPRLQEGLQYFENPNAKGYADFRKMYEDKNVQAVCVATPDHWHCLLTVMACAAGKDVYVEKPMTVFIDEGKWMVQAARQFKRVVVVGTQRRHSSSVAAARKVIESGQLGKITMVRRSEARNVFPGFGRTPLENPPAGLDYDMWLGPAPKRPYQSHRALYHFRWFWDYSGGQMTNLTAHGLDQMLWVMNVKMPTAVTSMGGRFALEDDGETPDTQEALFEYPGFFLSYAIREVNAHREDTATRGLVFHGTKGTMLLAERSLQIWPESHGDPVNSIPRFLGHPAGGPVYTQVKAEPWFAAPPVYQVPAGEDNMASNKRDWIDCIRSRKRPLCDVEDGHFVAVGCNLANISLRLGRSVRWDPASQQVIGDKEAAAMCTRPYRAPWDKELRSIVKV